MAKLTLVMERTPIQVFALDRPLMQVGRGEGVEILIDNVSVSRKQCEIRNEGRYWTVRDLGSSNGTSVNGVRLGGARRLEPGDEISFGKFSLFFNKEFDEPLAQAGIAPGTPKPHPPGTYYLGAGEIERLAQVIAAKRHAHLEWDTGEATGTFVITGDPVLIGRDETCHLRLAAAPRRGVLITRGPRGFEVRNLGRWIDLVRMRRNGTITRHAVLRSGDRIEIGRLRLTFRDEVR